MIYQWDVPSSGLKTGAIPGPVKWEILTPSRHGLYYNLALKFNAWDQNFTDMVLEYFDYGSTLILWIHWVAKLSLAF